MFNSILVRGIRRREQKQLTCMAFACCFLIALCFCTVFKPYLGPLPALNLQLMVDVDDLKELTVNEITNSQKKFKDTGSSQHEHENISNPGRTVKNTINSQLIVMPTTNSQPVLEESVTKKKEPVCRITKRADFCETKNDIRIDGSSAAVLIPSADQAAVSAENSSWIIRPYARKHDRFVMKRVKEWSVKSATYAQKLPECTKNHSVPAILFSSGGYAGNIFHDFSDIIIPLYITSRHFKGEVKFVITDKHSWWIKKYQNVLKKLSRYDVMDIDNEVDIHCFPSGIIGLKRHDKELNIDPSISPYSLKDFRRFIRSSFSLQKVAAIRLREGEKRKPRLLIIARKRTRAFTNPEEIAQMARKLGFDVVVTEASGDLSRFAETVNSCDVFLAVHGAAMTNMIFLPENAVFIQVVPFGGFEWLARTDYEEPAKAMKLKYLEYKIKLEESTLIKQYPLDHPVIRDPSSVGKQGWGVFRSVYMVKQNVQVDSNRFRSTLSKALELLHQ